MNIELEFNEGQLRVIADKLGEAVDRTASLYGDHLAEEIGKEAPVRTGDLSRSWFSKPTGRMEALVSSSMSYAGLVYTGRREIVARPGKALRFEINGQVIYAKRVKAVPPNRYIDRGQAQASRDIEDIVHQALKEAGL